MQSVYDQSGANWNNGSNAGVFARYFNNHRANVNNNVSFRALAYNIEGVRDAPPETSDEETVVIGNSLPASAKYSYEETLFDFDAQNFPINFYSGKISYETITDKHRLYTSFLLVRKHKRQKKKVHNLEKHIGTVISELYRELEAKTFKTTPCKPFIIKEPKPRLIVAPALRDSIVQHSIYNVVYRHLDKKFIFDSYGCRKEKGTHKASARTQYFMRQCSGESYNIQIDIKGYYFNIDHDILRKQLLRFIPDIDLVNLMMEFVDKEAGIGLNVGNLLSQLYGLIYLNQFDHYVKRKLKIKRYVRYVDDMVFIGFDTKEEAQRVLEDCVKYLREELCLTLSKYKITKNKKGLNYVGFRTWRQVKFLRKHSLYSFSKSLKTFNEDAMISIMGNALHSASFKYLSKILLQEIEKGERYDSKIQTVYNNWCLRIQYQREQKRRRHYRRIRKNRGVDIPVCS